MVDIETLKKMTGWDEAKLAAFITECANEGMSEDQIINAIGQQKSMDMGLDKISKPVVSDNTYVMPTVGEMIADGNITKETTKKEPSWLSKLSGWIKENAKADEERNTRAREAVAKSWNDYRDRTDPWFRVGLVNAIFGDNSMLNGYYNAMNSNAEAEKNRRAQMAYNAQIKATEDLNSTALKNAAAEKNFRDVIATIQDTGKALNNTQKNMVETAYKEMNDAGKEKYKEVMESLGLIKSEKESTEGSEAPRYETDLNQKYTKDDVQNTKAEINMMSNGPEKLARAQELNKLILANQASVEGGLGDGFTPEELKKFGTVPKAPIKKGTKLGKDKDPKNNPQHFDAKLGEWIKD